ncbi:MAG: 50S ribosomal protein L18 [Christensenellaceae bacterium]|jgi:large subunit ribosomal protein L18|nr:50S ribosomal protein L18 [Christensenellaceae bacterium]
MLNKPDRNEQRKKRHKRIRTKLSGTSTIPRLNVYKSTTNIYSQIIDDEKGVTLANASSLDKLIVDTVAGKTKSEVSKEVGKVLAERAIAKGINKVVFDRGGYVYRGRVKALADGAREGGLEF